MFKLCKVFFCEHVFNFLWWCLCHARGKTRDKKMCSGCVKSFSVNMSSTFFGGVYVMLEARQEIRKCVQIV